jgi:hypothetical protein
MKVLLTFDVEIWCGAWDRLDERFPAAFDRYVYGRSASGAFALPHTLDVLARHGHRGVFFIESLFAARFGIRHLRTIVDMIGSAGHDIQLHVHPEWADETDPPVVSSTGHKRPYFHQYSIGDQHALVEAAKAILIEAGVPKVSAFRAGGFAVGPGTFSALASAGIGADYSLNGTMPNCVPEWRAENRDMVSRQLIDGVMCHPMALFRDGFGRVRHAQVGACSTTELVEAMQAAATLGWDSFVVLSHNFEMLKPGSVEPDRVVAGRFEQLCEYLQGADELHVVATPDLTGAGPDNRKELPSVSPGATGRRFVEQLRRRFA